MERKARKVVSQMNFIDRSAEVITKSIRNNYPDAGSEVALRYSLILVINSTISILSAILFCSLTGHLYQCLIGIFAYILIRSLTGGLHASSSLSCCILSIIIFVTIAFTNYNYNMIFILLDIISVTIFLCTAPNNIKDMSNIHPKYYSLLKLSSLIIVSSNFLIQSTILTAAFFIQAFLTTKLAYLIKDAIERRWAVYEK